MHQTPPGPARCLHKLGATTPAGGGGCLYVWVGADFRPCLAMALPPLVGRALSRCGLMWLGPTGGTADRALWLPGRPRESARFAVICSRGSSYADCRMPTAIYSKKCSWGRLGPAREGRGCGMGRKSPRYAGIQRLICSSILPELPSTLRVSCYNGRCGAGDEIALIKA